ncbi:MAG: PAS domain S-box protein, partial [Candidatus Methanofastidiosa archaeon]|nr:PAS domain S-box protein [Candidatus Methanofastidiosa archaeon]
RDVEVYTSRITIGEIDVLHSIIHDITDRKRAERALQESECRYRTYIESAPGGVFIVDAQGTYLEVNDTACAMTGFSRKELLGMSIADLASPRAPPATLATFASLRGSGSVQGEILLRRADGTDFPSLLTAVVLPGGRYMGFCSDISELKQAEMALSEREEMWRVTLDSIGDAVITTDTEGKVTYMNPVAEELTGWRLPSVRGTPLSRVFHIVSALTGAPVENPVREVLERGTIVGLANHTKLLSRDGTAYQIADSAAPIHHADGSVTGVVLTFRDVTEEYELHEQMRQSEHQLRTLYDSMQEGLCMHEMLYGPEGEPVDYRIIDINARYEELVGMRRDLVVGRLATEIYGEPLYLGRYARVAATGKGGRFEAYYAPQDRYYAVSVFSPGKGFFATVFEDITGRKRVEKALHESEEKYRLITEHTGDNITVLDLSLNVVYTSPSIVRIRGYGVEEALNQSLDDILTPASQERVRAFFSVQMELEAARGADPGRSFTLEIEEYHKDGSVIPVEATLSFMRNAEGTPVGIVVVSRDISERKRAERALQESRQQLSDIIDNLPDATLAIDASGRIIFWNRAIEKMTGVPASEMLGKGGHAYTVPFYGEAREQLMDLLFYEREDIASRYPYLVWEGDSLVAEVFCSALNGGKGAWVIAKASPLRDASGALVGAIESIRDVSSQKRAEQELLKANKKLGILSDITRHDINNRLATLLGYAELSLDTATDWTVRDYLEKIYATARVMQEQIAFTRTYEGVGGMDPSWQDVGALLTSLSLPEGTAPPASCVGVEVYADPMLRQVFATLLDNTLRHAGTASPRVTVTCTHTKDGLVIAWEDDGVGVPENEKGRIFKRGYGKNTGLGLFLAREILAITGIGIREEGPPGAGARFVITVPPGAYRDAPRECP